MSRDLELSELTAEMVCGYLQPTSWRHATPKDRERWLADAQRYLDAIRALVAK